MPRHLRSTARLLLVALVAGTLGGCGTSNPVGPTALAETMPLESARASMPIGDAPALPDPGTWTPGPAAQQDAQRAAKKGNRQVGKKKPKKNR